MRIIELTDLYKPAIGGLELFVDLLSESLAARGHEVHVVTAALDNLPAKQRDGAVTVHRIPLGYQRLHLPLAQDPSRPFHPPSADLPFSRSLIRLMAGLDPDVLHAHSWSVHSALPSPLRVPVLATAHDYGLACVKKTLIDAAGRECPGPALRRCVPCAGDHYGTLKGAALGMVSVATRRRLARITKMTAVSDYVAERLTALLRPVTGEPVQTLHSFVPDGLHELGWSTAMPGDLADLQEGFILYVGQLSTHKGVPVLLDAYQLLPRPRPPLVLLGTPHPSFDVLQLPDGVAVRRNVPHAQVMAAMVRATCVVVPSVWPEPLPMTVSEAHNCGVPTIASNVGGIPEQLVDNVTGLLVPPGEPAALSNALGYILGDPARARAMGKAARERGRRFTATAGVVDVEQSLAATVESYMRHRDRPAAPRGST